MQVETTVKPRERREDWGTRRGIRRASHGGDPSAATGAMVVLAVILSAATLAAVGGTDPVGAGAAGTLSAPAVGSVNPSLADLAVNAPDTRVEVIAQLDPRMTFDLAGNRVRELGGKPGRKVRLIHSLAARMSARDATRLAAQPGVRHVSINGKIESLASRPAKLATAYSDSIDAVQGWMRKGLRGRGVGVAVVDTGVAGDLPDFRVSKTNELSRVRVATTVHPEATDAYDHYGHGTHIAGLIAGNGQARKLGDPLRGMYSGVAPGARLISIKASDDRGNASVLDVIYGIQFAVDHRERYDIEVLNLSVSSTVADSYLRDPLNAAVEAAWLQGITVVTAAGNDGDAADSTSYAPGNDPYVITVGAVDDQGTPDADDDVLAKWSSRGPTLDGHVKPEVLAPGAHMVSVSSPGSDFERMCPECVVDEGYFQAGGTSMAAAVTSGAVALILEQHPEWTPDEVKAALIEGARDVPGAGEEISVIGALKAKPKRLDAVGQAYPTHEFVDPVTGQIDYTVAKWRVAKWRELAPTDPGGASWAGASWRCDCSLDPEAGEVEPDVAKWRGASWRTSFTK